MRYINYRIVGDTFKRDYPFPDNWATDTDIKEWIGSCLFELNPTSWLEHRVTGQSKSGDPNLSITDYKGLLPYGFVAALPSGIKRVDGDKNVVVLPASDSFFMASDTLNQVREGNKDSYYRYVIEGDTITTSFEEGTVQLSYVAIPTDENGEPMIPDSEYIIRCLVLYIAERVANKLEINGQMPTQRYNRIRQDLMWAKAQAQIQLQMPTMDEAWQSLKDFTSLIRPKYANYFSFRNSGNYRF